jgi:hypothetical protein
MKTRTSLAVGVAFALALPALAQAASLPKSTASSLIVPAKSLGGVKLSSSIAAATAAWGKGGTCSASGCEYGGTSGASGKLGQASILLGKLTESSPLMVVAITIQVGHVGTTAKPEFNTPLTRFKTSSGIGLGSTTAQLKRAYPHVKSESAGVYNIAGAGESNTTFVAEKGRIESIQMESVHLG